MKSNKNNLQLTNIDKFTKYNIFDCDNIITYENIWNNGNFVEQLFLDDRTNETTHRFYRTRNALPIVGRSEGIVIKVM